MQKKSTSSAAIGLALLVAACGPNTVVAPVVEAVATRSSWNPRRLAPTEVPGVMALAGLNLPADDLPLVLYIDKRSIPTGTLLHGFGQATKPFEVRAAVAKEYRYGCDNGIHLMQAFTFMGSGAELPRGVAWLLEAPIPAWMSVEVVPLQTTTAELTREVIAGPLYVVQQMSSPNNGETVIEADGHEVARLPFELTVMSGYENTTSLDMRDEDTIGIPVPIAVWLLAPEGPALMAVRTNGYEGFSITTYLVGAITVEVIDSLSTYVYNCAA